MQTQKTKYWFTFRTGERRIYTILLLSRSGWYLLSETISEILNIHAHLHFIISDSNTLHNHRLNKANRKNSYKCLFEI